MHFGADARRRHRRAGRVVSRSRLAGGRERCPAAGRRSSWRSFRRQKLPIAHCREYDGFECAIWDAFAKRHGLPLVDLLGGQVQEQIRVGAWSGHRTLEEIKPLAAQFAEAGYDCIKFKCDLEDDVVGWCERIAEAAPGVQVILDPNERWETPAETRRRIEPLSRIGNVLCLEDPIPRWMLAEYAELKRLSPIPIVLHVSLPYIYHGQRVHDAIRALQLAAVDGFNFNGGLVGFQQLDRDRAGGGAAVLAWVGDRSGRDGSDVSASVRGGAELHVAVGYFWPADSRARFVDDAAGVDAAVCDAACRAGVGRRARSRCGAALSNRCAGVSVTLA